MSKYLVLFPEKSSKVANALIELGALEFKKGAAVVQSEKSAQELADSLYGLVETKYVDVFVFKIADDVGIARVGKDNLLHFIQSGN